MIEKETNKQSFKAKVINLETGEIEIRKVPIEEIQCLKIVRSKLTKEQVIRAEKLYPIVGHILYETSEEWIQGFTYDIHPEPEIQFWERLAVVFEIYTNQRSLNKTEKREVIGKLTYVMQGEDLKDDVSRDLREILEEIKKYVSAQKASNKCSMTEKEKYIFPWEKVDIKMFSIVYHKYTHKRNLSLQEKDNVIVKLVRLLEGETPQDDISRELLFLWKKSKEYALENEICNKKIHKLKSPIEQDLSADFEQGFNPENITDARKRSMSLIVLRQGQPKFRRDLLKIYNGRCPITGCNAEQALEAAHIIPYLGSKTNHPSNGLLLRADIHTLFDLHLLSIHPKTNKVVIASSLKTTSYGELDGKQLQFAKNKTLRPNSTALEQHYQAFLQKQNINQNI